MYQKSQIKGSLCNFSVRFKAFTSENRKLCCGNLKFETQKLGEKIVCGMFHLKLDISYQFGDSLKCTLFF
jgi:hypothetical protein